jgi:hypothetical protein
MTDGELQGWRTAFCPYCRKEYPVPAADFEDLQRRGDVMHCPRGHKIQLRPSATPQRQVAPRTPPPPVASPVPPEQPVPRGETAQRYCPYCRAATRQDRGVGAAAWICENAAKHRGDQLHWLEEAVANFKRRCDTVDRLEQEVHELRQMVGSTPPLAASLEQFTAPAAVASTLVANAPLHLEEWALSADVDDSIMPPELRNRYLTGNVYGHARVPDGTRIATARPSKIEGRRVTTQSGSVYILGEPEDGYREYLRKNYPDWDPENPIRLKGARNDNG